MYEVTEKSTMHGLGTPHGIRTPHRYPAKSDSLSVIFDDLITKLYPTGRAFYMKKNGTFNLLHQAINRSFIRVVEDGKLTIDGTNPNSNNFESNDASLWEYRLGLTTNLNVPLEQRKQAILRKMAYPSNIKARQHPSFIQSQLQLAGFDVYVHENTIPYKTPADIVALSLGSTQHSNNVQHGIGTQHGSLNFDVIANYPYINENYTVGIDNLWATFFIGGENLGEVANVPSNRMVEFKELVLKLKPAHCVAFIFINFV